MHIEELIQKVVPIDATCQQLAQQRFDDLIKPVGSLAQLETMISRYAGIVGKHDKNELTYPKRELLVWSGIAQADKAVEVMQLKTPVNVLAAETGAKVKALVVTADNADDALEEGATLVQEMINDGGLGLLGFGCLAGADDEMVQLAMAGGILMAAGMKVPVILDGVATCKAAKRASEMAPNVLDYVYAGHVSAEPGAQEAVDELGLQAPLRLAIPEGAGEGAALCFTIFDGGLKAYKEMETFEEAGVHDEQPEFSMAEEKKKGK